MTNRAIRRIQQLNSKKLDPDGKLLIRQYRFPRPTIPVVNNSNGDTERARRKRQIANGQLKKENGLTS